MKNGQLTLVSIIPKMDHLLHFLIFMITRSIKDEDEVTSEVNLAYTKLNIPFSYNCSPKLSLNLGPYISYLVSANYNEISDVTSNQNINSNYTLPDSQFSEEDIDYGIIAGISYYISDDLMILSSYN